ncbi:hypothetical protein ABTY61_22900 [Kitasatospora sp. NPDC096128]|uniref:hypothetical protein n=1 Tax=Kitasatospora sp. NPDC096128 TaxID=3155547 RepID=UPI003329249F
MTTFTRTRTRATSRTRRIILGAATLTLAAASVITTTSAAQASPAIMGPNPTWINGWSTYSNPWRCTTGSDSATFWCLYYNSNAEGAAYKSPFREGQGPRDWTYGIFQADAYGSRGAGQHIWHNAASAENASGCPLGVWSGYGAVGDSNWVPPYRGGNLTKAVKNKNEWAGVYCD